MEVQTDPRRLAEDWIAAWNAHDLDRIMAHYAPTVLFEADTVVKRWNRADGRLHGIDELREHFRRGLSLVPALHFELEAVFTAPSGYAALYRRENGNRAIDVVELDGKLRATAVRAYYLGEQN